MNYFVVCTGTLYLFSAGYSAFQGHWQWSLVWLCYGISALVLSVLEGS